MNQPPPAPKSPRTEQPEEDAPNLSGQYDELRTSLERLTGVLTGIQNLDLTNLDASNPERVAGEVLWRVCVCAILHIMYNQESINVLFAVRSSDPSVRSSVARSVNCNITWAVDSFPDLMQEARSALDALYEINAAGSIRLAEILVLGLELAKRQLDRLALAVRSDNW
jgi:hypothetical protein